jgi:hypothetical protein
MIEGSRNSKPKKQQQQQQQQQISTHQVTEYMSQETNTGIITVCINSISVLQLIQSICHQ